MKWNRSKTERATWKQVQQSSLLSACSCVAVLFMLDLKWGEELFQRLVYIVRGKINHFQAVMKRN